MQVAESDLPASGLQCLSSVKVQSYALKSFIGGNSVKTQLCIWLLHVDRFWQIHQDLYCCFDKHFQGLLNVLCDVLLWRW